MNIVQKLLCGGALALLMGATTINIGVNNQVNTGTVVGGDCRRGNGVPAQESRPVKPFREVAVDGVFAVNLRCGGAPHVAITADKNLQSLISTVVENDRLHLTTTESYCTDTTFVADIVVPKELAAITVDGSSEVTVDCSSTAADRLRVELRGTSTMSFSGTARSLDLAVQGSSEFDGTHLKVENAAVTASDATVVRVDVSKKLSGTVSGASEIHYLGTPLVKVAIEDAGEVVQQGQ